MKLLLELRTLPCYLSRGPFHILNIRNSEPVKQIEQADLSAIKNNSLLKYFEDEVDLDVGGGMFPHCGLLRLSLHRHCGQVSPLHALNR